MGYFAGYDELGSDAKKGAVRVPAAAAAKPKPATAARATGYYVVYKQKATNKTVRWPSVLPTIAEAKTVADSLVRAGHTNIVAHRADNNVATYRPAPLAEQRQAASAPKPKAAPVAPKVVAKTPAIKATETQSYYVEYKNKASKARTRWPSPIKDIAEGKRVADSLIRAGHSDVIVYRSDNNVATYRPAPLAEQKLAAKVAVAPVVKTPAIKATETLAYYIEYKHAKTKAKTRWPSPLKNIAEARTVADSLVKAKHTNVVVHRTDNNVATYRPAPLQEQVLAARGRAITAQATMTPQQAATAKAATVAQAAVKPPADVAAKTYIVEAIRVAGQPPYLVGTFHGAAGFEQGKAAVDQEYARGALEVVLRERASGFGAQSRMKVLYGRKRAANPVEQAAAKAATAYVVEAIMSPGQAPVRIGEYTDQLAARNAVDATYADGAAEVIMRAGGSKKVIYGRRRPPGSQTPDNTIDLERERIRRRREQESSGESADDKNAPSTTPPVRTRRRRGSPESVPEQAVQQQPVYEQLQPQPSGPVYTGPVETPQPEPEQPVEQAAAGGMGGMMMVAALAVGAIALTSGNKKRGR